MRSAGVRVGLLTLVACQGLVTMMAPPREAVAAGAPGNELLQVPLRWCAVEGSEALVNPGIVGEPTTNDYLWRRHERASDHVFIPGAGITFRSAYVKDLGFDLGFPSINDPKPPALGGAGVVGDILQPSLGDTEVKDALQACNVAWDQKAVQHKKALVGFPAINLRQFVDANGTPVTQRGVAYYNTGASGNPCPIPPTGDFNWNAMVAVSDYSYIRGFDPKDLTTAHELGHALGLGHGNGLDDTGSTTGVYDDGSSTKCDPTENENATPFTVMSLGNNKTSVLSALQRQTTRTIAAAYGGTVKDPPAALVPTDTVSDQRTDTVHEVVDGAIDLAAVAMARNTVSGKTIVSHALYGLIPREKVENRYLVFADLDDDPTTGGAPADLGLPTGFLGAELVTQVVVGPGHDARPTVWVFRDGAFEEFPESDFVRAEVATQRDSESGADSASVVFLELPTDLHQPIADLIRLQAVAEQMTGDGALDRLPDGADVGWLPLFFVPPDFPVCVVDPPQTQPGGEVRIEIAGLLPAEQVHVVLGDRLIANGKTDEAGAAEIEVVLPGDTSRGPRLVTVGVDGTALTADCVVEIEG